MRHQEETIGRLTVTLRRVVESSARAPQATPALSEVAESTSRQASAASAAGCPRSRVQSRSILSGGQPCRLPRHPRAVVQHSALDSSLPPMRPCRSIRRGDASASRPTCRAGSRARGGGARLDYGRQSVRAAGRGRAVRGIRVPAQSGCRAGRFPHRTAACGNGGGGSGARRLGLAHARSAARALG